MLDLGHATRNERARQMAATLLQRSGGFVSQVFRTPSERKAGYRFVESKAFSWRELAAPMYAACARRCADLALAICVIDGSSLAHTDNRGDDGVGPVGSLKAGGRGLKMMSLIVFDSHGVPLGVGGVEWWARAEGGATTPHAKRELHEKESRHWVTLPAQFLRICRDVGVETKLWLQMDAEGDANAVLMSGCDPRVYLTVRAHHDRLLFANSIVDRSEMHLREAVADAPVLARTHVRLRATAKRKARLAKLEIRAVHITPRLRTQWSHTRLADVFIGAVIAREIDPPQGEEALHWLLLTTHPIHSAEDVLEVVRAYALRWGIEIVHLTLKSGRNHVEDCQLESFGALTKWATLHLSAAVQAQAILKRSREQPDLPSDEVFERDLIDAALLLYQSHRRDAPKPGTTPSLSMMVHIIASLGGYTGKSSGGPPGIKTFTRGMDDVHVAALVLVAQRSQAGPT